MADRPVGVAVLGSSGSIGRQALEVLERLAPEYRIVALAAGHRADVLSEQARRLHPALVALGEEGASARLDLPSGTVRVRGPAALERLATADGVDLVVVGTGGIVALRPVLAALRAGRPVATANKETLVAGGHLVMEEARRLARAVAGRDPGSPLAQPLGWLRPIDSEHSAIWQCLAGEATEAVGSLVLTASGGPFLDTPAADLARVSPADALRHPTWTMGAKITIDSATLANKGLEIIEAHWLYGLPYSRISVMIHPQSVVHSAVLFVDGSMKAQLGTPDMRLPIQYAITYPARRPSPAAAPDLVATGRLEFRVPDEGRFPALRVAREAGLAGPRASAALIAADEVAVARFLAGTLSFSGIPAVLEAAVARFGRGRAEAPGLDELVALDAEVRAAYAGRGTAPGQAT